MKFFDTSLPGVIVLDPEVHGDERGFFLETFRKNRFREAVGADLNFVQDNHSRSQRGVLRGLHCQVHKPQGKLVRCVLGEVLDVAVDIDPGSEFFGHWVGVRLSSSNHRQIYVPPGYAHGFQVLSEHAEIVYKCTEYYAPGDESGLIWNDPEVGIEWPITAPILSAKDAALPTLAQIRSGG